MVAKGSLRPQQRKYRVMLKGLLSDRFSLSSGSQTSAVQQHPSHLESQAGNTQPVGPTIGAMIR